MQGKPAPRVTSIANDYGEVKLYRPLSVRIPEFLQAYPKDQGYRVEITSSNCVSHQSGLLELHKAAIAGGNKPEDMGLPQLPNANIQTFHASLIDKDGNVLETASSFRQINVYKDWEIGETAARQRLLAALGFGGDVFDEDEERDMRDQGLTVEKGDRKTEVPQLQLASSSNGQDDDGISSDSPDQDGCHSEVDDQATRSPDANDGENEQGTEKDEASTESATKESSKNARPSKKAQKKKGDSNGVPAHVMRRLEHVCKLKGIEVPDVKSAAEAKELIREHMV